MAFFDAGMADNPFIGSVDHCRNLVIIKHTFRHRHSPTGYVSITPKEWRYPARSRFWPRNRFLFRCRSFCGGRFHAWVFSHQASVGTNLLRISEALCPPKPKEFESTCCTVTW